MYKTDNLLADRLKALRKRSGYSQEFVASKLNIIRQTYSHYETGRIIPPIDSLYHLSKLYQVPVGSLLDLAMDKNNDAAPDEETVSLFYGAAPPSASSLTMEEKELLHYYGMLDNRDRYDILQFMKIKCSRPESLHPKHKQ